MLTRSEQKQRRSADFLWGKKTRSRKSVDDVDENCNFKVRLLQSQGRFPIVLELLLQLKKAFVEWHGDMDTFLEHVTSVAAVSFKLQKRGSRSPTCWEVTRMPVPLVTSMTSDKSCSEVVDFFRRFWICELWYEPVQCHVYAYHDIIYIYVYIYTYIEFEPAECHVHVHIYVDRFYSHTQIDTFTHIQPGRRC